MTHQDFLDNKEAIYEALYNAILKTLEGMTLEEIKQIDWFSAANYDRIGQHEHDFTDDTTV